MSTYESIFQIHPFITSLCTKVFLSNTPWKISWICTSFISFLCTFRSHQLTTTTTYYFTLQDPDSYSIKLKIQLDILLWITCSLISSELPMWRFLFQLKKVINFHSQKFFLCYFALSPEWSRQPTSRFDYLFQWNAATNCSLPIFVTIRLFRFLALVCMCLGMGVFRGEKILIMEHFFIFEQCYLYIVNYVVLIKDFLDMVYDYYGLQEFFSYFWIFISV